MYSQLVRSAVLNISKLSKCINLQSVQTLSNAVSPGNRQSENAKKQFFIDISKNCIDRMKKIGSRDVFLRITVDSGGCSGFQYNFNLDSKLQDEDECFEKDGVKVVVDKLSLPFINGATVDYHEELIRSAFRIINNPLAEKGCSCGSSFSVKLP